MTTNTRVPVLIVGGGGAGLTASMLLGTFGVESLLVSALSTTSIMPKAHILKSWGIGRHVLGSQLFCYHVDPHGFEVEHYTDGDMFDASHPTGYREAGLSGLYLWGPVLPPGFVDTRMTPERLARVLRGLCTREGFTLKRLVAMKRLYSQPPRPWAGKRLVRPRPR